MKFVSELKSNEFHPLVATSSMNIVNVTHAKFVKLQKKVYLKVCHECYLNDLSISSAKYSDHIVVVKD